ncbi:MAG: YhbY family RNA-binding protein [Candidatus Nitrotoga sp.]|jgi:RNA-binding protein
MQTHEEFIQLLTLTALQRQNLKARAHPLKPTVTIGTAGLTSSVLTEISCALKSHEIIKIKAAVNDRKIRTAMLENICVQLNAAAVQHIGKILVVYRPQEELQNKTSHTKIKALSKRQLGSH